MRAGWLAGGEGAPEARKEEVENWWEREAAWLVERRERESWLFLLGEGPAACGR